MNRGQIIWVVMVALGAVSLSLLTAEEPRLPLLAPGHSVPVEITLVPEDLSELSCAAPSSGEALRCAFGSPSAAAPAADPARDAQLLQPYTTVDQQQFLAAGLWTHRAVQRAAQSAGGQRFSVLCDLHVTGRAPHAFVRWRVGGEWQAVRDWPVGEAKDCAPP